MPNESIVFDPQLDERQLDREVRKTNDRLQQVGQDLPVSFDQSQMDSLQPPTGGMGGGLGGMGPGPLGAGIGAGAGSAGAVGALSEKLPDSVAGVTVGKALPIALAGGVGLGILSQLQQASGALQTTTNLFGTAMNLFFRPFGNFLGRTLRPFALGTLQMAQDFADLASDEGLMVAVASLPFEIGEEIGGAFSGALEDLMGGEADIGDFLTIGGTIGGATLLGKFTYGTLTGSGLLGGFSFGSVTGAALLSKLTFGTVTANAFLGAMTFNEITSGDLTGAMLSGGITGATLAATVFGGVSISSGLIVGTVFGGAAVTGAEILDTVFGGGLEALPEGEKLAKRRLGRLADTMGRTQAVRTLIDRAERSDDVSRGDVLAAARQLFGEVPSGINIGAGDNAPDRQDPNRPGDVNPPTEPDTGDPSVFTEPAIGGGTSFTGLQSGGRVTRTGVAQVHRGELVADPDRLVTELAQLVTQNTADAGDMDMTAVEDKLDRLNRNLTALRSALDVTLEVDKEQLGRATTDARRNRLADRDPSA
jgi:hypothetical protein